MVHHDFAAGFVIYRLNDYGERTYLLIQNAGGYWELPKGHAKSGENWLQAALRELKEETGIVDAKPLSGFARQVGYVYRTQKHGLIRKTVFFACGQTKTNRIRISHEHIAWQFFSLPEAVNQVTFVTLRGILIEADAFLNTQLISNIEGHE